MDKLKGILTDGEAEFMLIIGGIQKDCLLYKQVIREWKKRGWIGENRGDK